MYRFCVGIYHIKVTGVVPGNILAVCVCVHVKVTGVVPGHIDIGQSEDAGGRGGHEHRETIP